VAKVLLHPPTPNPELTLVGRDCSKFLDKAPGILRAMEAALKAKGCAEADIRGYVTKHLSPLLVLQKIVPLIGAARLLSDEELYTLDREAANYGELFSKHFSGSFPTESAPPC